MTRDLLRLGLLAAVLALFGTGVAVAEEPPPPAPDGGPDDLRRYRTPFPVLAERAIGTASQPVEFIAGPGPLAATGDQLLSSTTSTACAPRLFRCLLEACCTKEELRLGLGHASSELLALTPYRQPGRAPRVELDLQVGLPLAEGSVTTRPRWLPAAQLVLNGYVGLRYLFYPSSFEGMRAGEVFTALVSPRLTRTERENLQERRLDAMRLDAARYALQVGLGNDLYFRQGVFLSPRAMLALPVLAPATRTQLRLSGSLTLAVGAAW